MALPPLSARYPVAVAGLGYTVLAGIALPKWAAQGYLVNCTSTYAPPVPADAGTMPLAQCLVACLRDAKCDAVTVEWVQKQVWPPPASLAGSWHSDQVRCSLRGGVDLATCAKDPAEAHSTITVQKKTAAPEALV